MNDWPSVISRSRKDFSYVRDLTEVVSVDWRHIRNYPGESPLHVAIVRGHIAATRALLSFWKRSLRPGPGETDRGWLLVLKDHTGRQPLEHAIQRMDIAAVDVLLGTDIIGSHECIKLYIRSHALAPEPKKEVVDLILHYAKDACHDSLDEILYTSLEERIYWIMEPLLACGANPDGPRSKEGLYEMSSLVQACTMQNAPGARLGHFRPFTTWSRPYCMQ